MFKKITIILVALLGLFDAAYLAYEHFSDTIPPCTTGILFADCGKVLNSSYSMVAGVPLAILGVFHYAFVLLLGGSMIISPRKVTGYLLIFEITLGFLISLYLVFLQAVVIQALCIFCMLSAIISTLLFISMLVTWKNERKQLALMLMHGVYVYIAKPLFFLIPPERVHVIIVRLGETLGSQRLVHALIKFLLYQKKPKLEQHIAGILFHFPIGLAAGYDYEARLTRTLSPWGFGFQSIGTITNQAYSGNPGPMLGRLPQSKSLMVNKGFKNLGAETTIAKLKDLSFPIPVGISIGKTNTLTIKNQKEAIVDIISAFKLFEKASIKHSYYELNISCPNLLVDISFYQPNKLDELLKEIDKLHLTRPLFIKMPIEKTDTEVEAMLAVIVKHSPAGVIFGNLQKNRNDKAFVKKEVARFKVGNFSGKPTFERSNELIALTYKKFGNRLIIIGCGGVFSAEDAYKKITLGASLVQMITGMIFEGPSLVMQINYGLCDLLKKDGFRHISEAVGSKNKRSN